MRLAGAGLLLAGLPGVVGCASAGPIGLGAAVRDAGGRPLVSYEVISPTPTGGELGVFILSSADDPHSKPALVIVAGVDGRHVVGSQIASRLPSLLAERAGELLDEMTVYVIPVVHDEAINRNASGEEPRQEHRLTSTPVDLDGDGRVDEDGPVDIDGDGIVTMMRWRPGPGSLFSPTHIIDPDEPRLMREPDPKKGEVATHALHIEGRDRDGDGRIAEDPPGGVDLDIHWPYRWPEWNKEAGRYQLEEPHTRALAHWLLERQNIVAFVTYGLHDNLVKAPEAGRFDITRRVPLGIEQGDLRVYEVVGEKYREITGMTGLGGVTRESAEGSFHGWAYAHYGRLSFVNPVWVRPDLVERRSEETAAEEEEAEAERDTQADAQEEAAQEERPRRAGARGAQAPQRQQRDTRSEDAKWLAYSDEQRDGEGFVEWRSFDHPDLGEVEIGGFVPGFRFNPPDEELGRLAEEQASFAIALLEMFPRLEVSEPVVESLGGGVYRITLRLSNPGKLATRAAISNKVRRIAPIILRPDVEPERIVSGERLHRVSPIGPGGHADVSWIINASGEDSVTIEVHGREMGDRTVRVELGGAR
ncbi:MAG: hypothetical protein JJU33_12175 [Phycisphaerales bacterium]|nr:hypothetical protein [Phycisphaerales bacterium]